MKKEEIRSSIANLFDENTNSPAKRRLDYTIWSFILISTLVIFLSTYSNINKEYGSLLNVLDIATTLFFTVEVTLRIWTVDLVDYRYKGLLGRFKYCLSFYGFVDFISTYAFYIGLFVSFPVAALKVVRVARLLRIFRFMKSFRLLTAAISNKGKEMFVSLQFLVIITIILSFILFFAENEAQPNVYTNGMTPVLWAFMQYIGDPGGFGDYPPVTFVGRIIACVIGILGIAIFAVPAGLIGSGFTDEMEKDSKKEKNIANAKRILTGFKYTKNTETGLYTIPRYLRMTWLQTRLGLSQDEIIAAVSNCPVLRMKDLGTAQPNSQPSITEFIVETFPVNRPYGCCIDRGSKITIVATTSATEPSNGTFCFYLAMLGGFNFVSKEYDKDPIYMTSFYNIETFKDEQGKTTYLDPNIELFLADIKRLSDKPGSVVIPIIASDGRVTGDNPKDEQLHFHFGQGKNPDGLPNYNCQGRTLTDETVPVFDQMYQELGERLFNNYGYKTDVQKYGALIKNKNLLYLLDNGSSGFCIRIACQIVTWNVNFVGTAQIMADTFAKYFSKDQYPLTIPTEMQEPNRIKHEDYGYGFYKL